MQIDLSRTKYEEKLLLAWESVYKKGQLTLWILLSLADGEKHMATIKDFIEEKTQHTISADDRSMYRALRRFKAMELIEYYDEPSDRGGPVRKIYRLTEIGNKVLTRFIQKNIINIYYHPAVMIIMKGKL